MNMKKLLKRNEFYVILIIVVLSLLIQMKSGQFFTANNIVDLVRSLIVPGMWQRDFLWLSPPGT